MEMNPGLPILGQAGPSGPNGGGKLAAIDKKYAVELSTADGGFHTVVFSLARRTGPTGILNLGALKDFNPEAEVMMQVGRIVTCAQLRIPLKDGELPPVIVKSESGIVVWQHVASFTFLGEWDPETRDVVADAESRASAETRLREYLPGEAA